MYWALLFTSFGFHVAQIDDWDHLSRPMRAVVVVFYSVCWPIWLFQLVIVLLLCLAYELSWWDYRRRQRLMKAAGKVTD